MTTVTNPPVLAIVKLAAIGDVAIASRALDQFCKDYQLPEGTQIHWITDQKYFALIQSLINSDNKNRIHFHHLDSEKLFQGGITARITQGFRLFWTLQKTHPQVTLLLHRDNRYALAAKFAGAGEIIQIQNEDIRELKLYEKAFKKLALKLELTANNIFTQLPERSASPIKRIGLLVGGGKSATGTFYEKRWPRLSELIHIILHETNFQISLFGGQDDIKAANSILNLLSDELITAGRIENLVGTVALSNLPDQLCELDTFISVDSGLAHIAAAVMTAPHQKVITLFGPTDPHLWAPTARGKAQSIDLYKFETCSPCYQNDGDFKHCIFSGNDFQKCMTSITPEDVLETLISS